MRSWVLPSMAEFTCPLTNGPSVRYVMKKTFLFFIWIQWKLLTLPSFHWIRMKNKKVFLMTLWTDCLSVRGRWIRPTIYNGKYRKESSYIWRKQARTSVFQHRSLFQSHFLLVGALFYFTFFCVKKLKKKSSQSFLSSPRKITY